MTARAPAAFGMSRQPGERWTRFATRIDRKSTRLNSSHSQISYAVFCLKKKNDEYDSWTAPIGSVDLLWLATCVRSSGRSRPACPRCLSLTDGLSTPYSATAHVGVAHA